MFATPIVSVANSQLGYTAYLDELVSPGSRLPLARSCPKSFESGASGKGRCFFQQQPGHKCRRGGFGGSSENTPQSEATYAYDLLAKHDDYAYYGTSYKLSSLVAQTSFDDKWLVLNIDVSSDALRLTYTDDFFADIYTTSQIIAPSLLYKDRTIEAYVRPEFSMSDSRPMSHHLSYGVGFYGGAIDVAYEKINRGYVNDWRIVSSSVDKYFQAEVVRSDHRVASTFRLPIGLSCQVDWAFGAQHTLNPGPADLNTITGWHDNKRYTALVDGFEGHAFGFFYENGRAKIGQELTSADENLVSDLAVSDHRQALGLFWNMLEVGMESWAINDADGLSLSSLHNVFGHSAYAGRIEFNNVLTNKYYVSTLCRITDGFTVNMELYRLFFGGKIDVFETELIFRELVEEINAPYESVDLMSVQARYQGSMTDTLSFFVEAAQLLPINVKYRPGAGSTNTGDSTSESSPSDSENSPSSDGSAVANSSFFGGLSIKVGVVQHIN